MPAGPPPAMQQRTDAVFTVTWTSTWKEKKRSRGRLLFAEALYKKSWEKRRYTARHGRKQLFISAQTSTCHDSVKVGPNVHFFCDD
jgi:hypothetical protein